MGFAMEHLTLSRGALAIGLLPGITAFNPIFRPEAALRGLGFPVPAEGEGRKLSFMLTRVIGVRNVMISFLLTLIWQKGGNWDMALGLTTVLTMSVMDGFISRILCGGGEMNHWGFAPAIAAVMTGILGWY